ncbi:MAG TPA: hypothetical protein VKS60_09295 [Stellaceae bacterium]|nr:hypothetical protein [Stellaceae bacterium]
MRIAENSSDAAPIPHLSSREPNSPIAIFRVGTLFAISEYRRVQLIVLPAAASGLRTLPGHDAAAMIGKLKLFAADPHAKHGWAKAFAGGKGRIRHGDWRATYLIDAKAGTVTIVTVKHRREVYR